MFSNTGIRNSRFQLQTGTYHDRPSASKDQNAKKIYIFILKQATESREISGGRRGEFGYRGLIVTVAAVKDLAAAGCSNHAPSPIMLASAERGEKKKKKNSAVGSEEDLTERCVRLTNPYPILPEPSRASSVESSISEQQFASLETSEREKL